jgi:hypothetical protein
MSAFSEEQQKELEGCVNAASQLSTRSANVYTSRAVADAIVAERERLARIVETCAPFTDLAATLQELGRYIRTGRRP